MIDILGVSMITLLTLAKGIIEVFYITFSLWWMTLRRVHASLT